MIHELTRTYTLLPVLEDQIGGLQRSLSFLDIQRKITYT